MKKIEITEEDIFTYALTPDELEPGKKIYIEENYNFFRAQIESAYSTLDPFEEDVQDFFTRCFETINEQSINIIELFPDIPVDLLKQKTVVLAAASDSLQPTKQVISFKDKCENFLIRFLANESVNQLWIYSKTPITLPVKLIIFPSCEEYIFYDISIPLEILQQKTIEKIELSSAYF